MDIKEKKLLFQLAIQRLEARVLSLDRVIKEEKEAIKGTPTAMESWSDTNRSQKERLVENLERERAQAAEALAVFKEISVEQTETVTTGSVLEIAEAGRKFLYMIVPGLTIQLRLKEKDIKVVSKDSPIARAIFGHKAGETVRVEVPGSVREFKILSVF